MSPRTRHHSRTFLRTALVLFALFAHTRSVLAVERERTGTHAARARLETANEAELPTLLQQLAATTPRTREARSAAARSVANLLGGGHADEVSERALEALAALAITKPPSSVAAASRSTAPAAASAADALPLRANGRLEGWVALLVQYTQHRRPTLRALALRALAQVAGNDKPLRAVVAEGLRDSTPEVRAAAARGLETLRASEATELLLRALTRGVPEAAATLGAVGAPGSLEMYGKQLTKQPLDVMLSGYQRYLVRADLKDDAKLEVVAQLEELASAPVLRFLTGLAREPQLSPALRQAALASSARIAAALAPQRSAAGGSQ